MAIRKRGKGHWQVRVRPFPDMTFPTREAAQTVERDLKLRVKLGHLYREKPVTLGQELDGYLARKAAMGGRRGPLRPRSIAFLQQSAKPWQPLRKVLVPNLRRAMVEDHLVARAAVAPVAAANELELLKACLRAAASRGQSVDPGIFAIAPVRHEPVEGVALELEQLHEIASTMPERIKRLVPFCGTVGLRFTEAVTLTDDRVDLAAGEIVITRELSKGRRAKTIPLARFETQLLREQSARPPGRHVSRVPEREGRRLFEERLPLDLAARSLRGWARARGGERRKSHGRRRGLPLPLAPAHGDLADGACGDEARADRRPGRAPRRRRADLPPLPAPLSVRDAHGGGSTRCARFGRKRRGRRRTEWSLSGQPHA